jgi:hypothetical protein
VTTTLSLGVEVGVGELPGGNVVEVGTEVGVLLGDHEDVNAVDEGKTDEGPSETHDTLFCQPCTTVKRRDGKKDDIPWKHRGTREHGSLRGSSESPSSCRGQ